MSSFFWKDVLLYWRDRKEIAIALTMPLVIILVLGFALSGLVENPADSLDMTVAIVHADDEQASREQFLAEVAARSLPEETVAAIASGSAQIVPAAQLMNVFQHEEVRAFLRVEPLEMNEALERLRAGRVDAVVHVPERFTHAVLRKLLLDEGEGAAIEVIADKANLRTSVLADLVNGFLDSWNMQAAIRHNADTANVALPDSLAFGGREQVDGVQPVTAFQYYALAVGIVFALFVAITTASKAITEKRERVFERMLLTGAHPLHYLSGKFASTVCIALAQLFVVMAFSHWMLDIFPGRSWTFWLGLCVMLVMLALCTGALAALFTVFVFRMQDAAANGLATLVIIVIGTIGGSFVPVYVLPKSLQLAGEWTPNGLTLAVLMEWLQTEHAADLALPIAKLALFALLVSAAAITGFPRRGRI